MDAGAGKCGPGPWLKAGPWRAAGADPPAHTPQARSVVCSLLPRARPHFLGACNPWGVEQHLSLSPAELCSQAVSSLY